MRIGMISPSYYPPIRGGGMLGLKLLAESLATRHSVQVISFDGSGVETINGVSVKRFRNIKRIRELKNIFALIKILPELENVDILHSYNQQFHPVTGFLGRYFGIKTLATFNNNFSFFPPEYSGFPPRNRVKNVYFTVSNHILLPFVKQIDRLVCVSPSVRAIYEKNGMSKKKLVVIPDMIDDRFSNLNIVPHELRRVLYTGRLDHGKGIDFLIKAIAMLKDKNIQLWIVGEGPLRPYLVSLRDSLGLGNQVSFLGHVPYEHIDKIYVQCDLFVHPSTGHEAMNRTLYEALQVGLLIIATKMGGPAQLLPESVLCAPRNAEALATKIEQVFKNRSAYNELLIPVRQWLFHNMSPESVTSQYIREYIHLLQDWGE